LKKKGPHIRPPFPWSTEYRAKNHSLEWILHLGISSIRGEVQCKRCDGMATVEVSLEVTVIVYVLFFYSHFCSHSVIVVIVITTAKLPPMASDIDFLEISFKESISQMGWR
jgi:hypothetical protein